MGGFFGTIGNGTNIPAPMPEQMTGWGRTTVHDPNELPAVLKRWNDAIATGSAFEMVFPRKYPPAKPGALGFEPLKAACRPLTWPRFLILKLTLRKNT